MSPLEVGVPLPPLTIPVTARLVVAGAIASRDFQDVHHDFAGAQAAGSPDIFMNILTTNGLVGRYVTDWAGPAARLTAIDIRLGAPNRPGATLEFTGSVTTFDPVDARATVSVRGRNELGDHVTGTVEVEWPSGELPGGLT
ncbi:MAG TPA: MaoC/PaaZ C-terminal domain-containing protein [Frankiaceae bacterium]|jgi:acyl dehydratase|nr:MaoC/PaaZ C-terminal domain-containing protein [Frankiaceae bacterium]